MAAPPAALTERAIMGHATTLLLGAVACDPEVVTIWDGFKAWLARRDLDFDYVLYSNYERQVEALLDGAIHVAWNSPLAWVRAARLARARGAAVRALAMRDTDRDLTSVIVVRADAPIRTLADLKGKRIAVGAIDSPPATLIPLDHLRAHGRDPKLRGCLAAAIERRHAPRAQTSGLNEEVFDALVLLAAGTWRSDAIAAGFARVQALKAEMAAGRRRRLTRLGFTEEAAAALAKLHTRNFMQPLSRAVGRRLHGADLGPLRPGPRPRRRDLVALVELVHAHGVAVLALLLLALVRVEDEVELADPDLVRARLVGAGGRDGPRPLALGARPRLDVDVEPHHLLRARHRRAAGRDRRGRDDGSERDRRLETPHALSRLLVFHGYLPAAGTAPARRWYSTERVRGGTLVYTPTRCPSPVRPVERRRPHRGGGAS